ncbi:MAG TPA: hypothetical protein VG755_03400 [Nannocystaceae bacterium]|nr:hypothetical protein [Nannocystaceae bacterium]
MIASVPAGTRTWHFADALDPIDMFAARRQLAEIEPLLDLADLDDDAVLFQLRELDEHEEERERRERLRREVKPRKDDAAFEDATDLHELVERHRLAFLVLDGGGQPFPGVPWRLFEQGSVAAEGKLGNDGMVRRDSVTHDDYALELVDILDVRWVAGGKGSGAHALEIACTGIADGTALQVLVFEELREQDGEEIAKLDAKVQGDRARVEWSIAADRLAELADEDGRVRVVAEVRGPSGTWRKPDASLELAAPTIVSIAWSDATELVVTTLGVDDGTKVRCEIWHAPLAAAPESLAELSDAVVTGDRVVLRWSPPSDRCEGLECWPTVETATLRATGPMCFVSPPADCT